MLPQHRRDRNAPKEKVFEAGDAFSLPLNVIAQNMQPIQAGLTKTCARRLRVPVDQGAGVEQIGAVGAGANGPLEVVLLGAPVFPNITLHGWVVSWAGARATANRKLALYRDGTNTWLGLGHAATGLLGVGGGQGR